MNRLKGVGLLIVVAVLLLLSQLLTKEQLLRDFLGLKQPMRETEKQGETILQTLSDEIQKKIWERQNPENCDEARLLVYDVDWHHAGFTSTTHVLIMHFLLALYRNRTLVYISKGWAYDEEGSDHYFLPLGKCKFIGDPKTLPRLSEKVSDVRVMSSFNVNLYDAYNWKVPRNILAKVKHLHQDPFAWWVAQFVKYRFRFQPWLIEVLKAKEKTVPLTNSTVCLHIRWGDKILSRAKKHPVSEYMELASEWFKRPEHQNSTKTIFVATEESKAWRDLEDNYPDFSFIGSGYVDRNKQLDIQYRNSYGKRRNELEAIVTDIYFLSKCPYVVCTLSSGVCRILYELMAIHNNNPEDAINSIDQRFYRLKGDSRNYRAIQEFHANGKLQLKIGDIFKAKCEMLSPRRNGGEYKRGANIRTKQTDLLVPKYKLEAIVVPLDFEM